MVALLSLLAVGYSPSYSPALSNRVIGARSPAIFASEALSRRGATATAVGLAGLSALGMPAESQAAGYPGLVIKTTEGDMEFELWDDVAPK